MAKKIKISSKVIKFSDIDLSRNLFLSIITINALIVFALQLIRTSTSENWDKAVILTAVSFGALIFFARLFSPKILPNRLSLLSLVVLVIGILSIEKHGTQTTRGVDVSDLLWLGFGPWVAFVALFLVPFVASIYSWDNLGKKLKLSINVLAIAITVFVIPAIWQGGASIIDRDSSEYVLNETLSVSAGHFPYVDFIPQYGTMYAWILAPFSGLLTADQLVTLSFYLMSFGTIIAIGLGVFLAHRALGKRSVALAVLLTIPFTSLAQFPDREVYSGTIFSLFSQLPIRLLPGLFLGYLVTVALCGGKSLQAQMRLKIFISFIAGLNLWINQDFALLAGLVSLVFLIFYESKFKSVFFYIFSFLIGIAIYPALMLVAGFKVNFKFIGFFAVQYKDGFMAEPIITPGPVLIILPITVALVGASYFLVIRERFNRISLDDQQRLAVLTSAFFSTWSLLGFAYYLNRSYASGQMQILFLPLAIASASLFAYLNPRDGSTVNWKGIEFFKIASWSKSKVFPNLSNIVVGLVMALPLATIVAFPNPNIEIDRLTSSSPNHVWPKPGIEKLIQDSAIVLKYAEQNNLKVAFFGASGNYVELRTGVPSANILNSPWDMPVTQTTLDTGCQRLLDVNADLLLVGEEGPSLFRFQNQTLCAKYAFVSIPELSPARAARKIN